MAENNIRTEFQYDADFGPLLSQIKSLIGQINALNAQFNSLDANSVKVQRGLAQTFLGQMGSVGGFKAQIVDLVAQTDRFGNAIVKNKLGLREYFNEARGAFKENSNTMRLAQQQVRMLQSQMVSVGKGQAAVLTPTTLNLKDYNTQLQVSAQRWSIFNKLVGDGTTSLINFGKNTQWAGRQLMVGLTLPLTVFGVTLSKTFREVDAELTRFAKVYGSDLAGANKKATDDMKQQILDLGKTYGATYGIAAKETIALAADIAATGLEGKELMDSVAQTTRLAVLGEVDRQEAMRATLSLQNAFNQNTQELADSINFLNAVENQTSTTLQDFTAAIPKAGPVVKGLGGDIKDLALMLTAMREGGVNATEGANAIKSGLASLINPTKQAKDQLMGFGINLDQIVKSNRGELIPTIMAFKAALDSVDEFTRSQAIEAVFGKFQFARLGALFDNLGETGSQTLQVMDLMGASSKELGEVADEEIRTLTQSTSMRFSRAMEAIKSSLLSVGNVITETIIPFMNGLANTINYIVEAFKSLPEPVQKFLKFFAGFTVVAGPIIMLVGLLANFGGYIAKGVLGLTNLGRMLLGLPVNKFQLLTADIIAANNTTDILTTSFVEQGVALSRLNTELARYVTNLRATTTANPNLLVGRGVKKYNTGVTKVPGSGNRDTVPAMLTPGESVIPKDMTQKHAGLINSIIKDRIPGYNGGLSPSELGISKGHLFENMELTPDGRKRFAGTSMTTPQPFNQLFNILAETYKKNPSNRALLDSLMAQHGVSLSGHPLNPKEMEKFLKFVDDLPEGLTKQFGPYRNEARPYIEEMSKINKISYRGVMVENMAHSTAGLFGTYGSPEYKAVFERESKHMARLLDKYGDDPTKLKKVLERRSAIFYPKVGISQKGKASTPSKSMIMRGPSGATMEAQQQAKMKAAGEVPLVAHKNEAVVPLPKAQEGVVIDSKGNTSTLKKIAGSQMVNRASSMGLNAAFMLPMLGMMNEKFADTANKLSMFALSLSAASMALKGVAGMGGKTGMLATAGKNLQIKGRAMRAFGGKSTLGKGMMVAGRGLSLLGGPIGIAIAGLLVGIGLLVKKIKDANKEMTAAFAEGTKSAEYFGIELNKVAKAYDAFGNSIEDTGELDETVKSDFGTFIEKIKDIKNLPEIQSEFRTFYGNLLSQGFDVKQAQQIVSSVARQAEKTDILLSVKAELRTIKTPEDVARSLSQGMINAAKPTAAYEGIFKSDEIKAAAIAGQGLMRAYAAAPLETMNSFLNNIDKVGKNSFQAKRGVDQFAKSIAATDPILSEAILKAETYNEKMLLIAASGAGLDVSKPVTEAMARQIALADQASLALSEASRMMQEDLENTKMALERNHTAFITNSEDEIYTIEQLIKTRLEEDEARKEANEEAIDSADKRITLAEKEIDKIEEQRDIVNDFYEGQLDALDKINKKEEFMSDQRSTMYDALGALSRGDYQGFFEAREQLAFGAGEFVRDQARDILLQNQERANSVLDAQREKQESIIDIEKAKIDALREQNKLIDKRQKAFLKAKEVEIEGIREAMREEQKRFTAANDALEALYNQDPSKWSQKSLNNLHALLQAHTKKVAGTIGDTLENVSAMVPKVFSDYYTRAAQEAGLNPADVKNMQELQAALSSRASTGKAAGARIETLLDKMGLGAFKGSSGIAQVRRVLGIPAMHTGGYVGGNQKEPLKTLERGEYVLNKKAVNDVGVNALNQINSGGYRYGMGGMTPYSGPKTLATTAHLGNEMGVNSAVYAMKMQTFGMDSLRLMALNKMSSKGRIGTQPVVSPDGEIKFIRPPGPITSPFGFRQHPVTGEFKLHDGIDFGLAPGRSVPAIGPGVVSFSGSGPDLGGRVKIRHGNGFVSDYYHLNPGGLPNVGSTVGSGDTIGTVGTREQGGRLSTGPHLHLGLNGPAGALNPAEYLPLRKGGIVKKDGTPAMLHRGEMVLPAPSAKELMSPKYNLPSRESMAPELTTISLGNTNINISISSNQNPNVIANQVISKINNTINSRKVGRS